MLGCHADAASEEISVDLHEISDAKWFERDVVARALAASEGGRDTTSDAEFAVPPPMAIAHQLMRAWALPGR
jgi:NAD+ diphosphatase